MVDKSLLLPTEAELEILAILWNRGPCTVRQVVDEISNRRVVGYTTILKLMQIMFEKALVLRDVSQRSHLYHAKTNAEVMQRRLLADLAKRAFGGSQEKLVLQALSTKRASKRELAEIRRLLDTMEKEAK